MVKEMRMRLGKKIFIILTDPRQVVTTCYSVSSGEVLVPSEDRTREELRP
jgi:hypothetical protein